MAQGTLKIHTENILPIIKRWLYSDKDIFIRELVSNSCDALAKLKILRDQHLVDVKDEELKIELKVDRDARTIEFIDTGIGMTSEEVEKYIAQVAFSGAEEFLSQYQKHEQIIGHFGLGFYSAFMVAEKVTIDTLSYQPNSMAAFWSCTGSSEYELDLGTRKERGTTITLHLGEGSEEFLDVAHLREVLRRYCLFLPYPIYLNGDRINEEEPLWVKGGADCSENDYLSFYHTLYPADADPIFWIHLNVDVPFHLKGILYFPKMNRRFDWSKSNIHLFVNRVFVSDNCKDLIPDFLMCLKGAIDSPDIPLNVSRSSLQLDRTVRSLSSHISKKVADKLSSLFLNDREKFIAAWPEIEMIVKLGMLQDEKFYARAKEFLVWKSLDNTWITLDALPEKLFYTTDSTAPLLDLYKSQTVIISTSPLDGHLFSFLESKEKLKFQRIDGAVDATIVDASREKTVLDSEGRTESSRIADFFRKTLSIDVEAKSLASDALPGFILFDEASRRLRDVMALTDGSTPFPTQKRFVVNTNHKLVNTVYRLHDQKPDLAASVATHLYDLACLAQKELSQSEMNNFVNRSTAVLERLMSDE